MSKRAIPKARDRNQVVANIVDAMVQRQGVLKVGRHHPHGVFHVMYGGKQKGGDIQLGTVFAHAGSSR